MFVIVPALHGMHTCVSKSVPPGTTLEQEVLLLQTRNAPIFASQLADFISARYLVNQMTAE